MRWWDTLLVLRDLAEAIRTTIWPKIYDPLSIIWSSFIYSFFSAQPLDQRVGSKLINFFYLYRTIRQKYMVLFHLFFLLCTTIRQKYMVFFHLSLFLCTTIWPKIKVHTDLFLYMYTTIRPKINVHIDSFFYLHTAIRQKYMIFFLSFILSLCTTIRPKNRVLINLLFLFVHKHSAKLGVTLALLFILFLDVPIFCLLYSWQILPLYFHRSVSGSTAFIFRPLYS